ncbi:hypothetical protein J6590_069479 [Homalodisca vitripennis]|nr:hypothetical protein J6590_069479 [Homalodisca vitripennis]
MDQFPFGNSPPLFKLPKVVTIKRAVVQQFPLSRQTFYRADPPEGYRLCKDASSGLIYCGVGGVCSLTSEVLANFNKGVHPLPTLTGETGSELASHSSKDTLL